jgi:hypothetical protein
MGSVRIVWNLIRVIFGAARSSFWTTRELALLGGVAVRLGDRAAGYGDSVASRGVQALLDPQELSGRVGRPALDPELVGLIRKMSKSNV